MCITLFTSTTTLCGTDMIMQSTLHIQREYGEIFCRILSASHNIVMDLNKVMCPRGLFWL